MLEFTSPTPEAGYLPQWMMDHLGVKEGEEMKFEYVDLPKRQFVMLQPVSSAWLVSAIHVNVMLKVFLSILCTCIHCMLHMYLLYARQQPFFGIDMGIHMYLIIAGYSL